MRKLIKKTVALTAAFAMTLSMSAVAGAATDTTGSIDTDSQLEGYVDKTVYDITVPTVADGDLDFTVDPQGLLNVANSTTYAQTSGAVYFTNAGSPATYSNTSDAIELINNSSFDIDVSLDVKVTAADAGITLVEKAALTSATDPSLYLGLIVTGEDGTADSAVAITDDYTGTPETLSAVAEIDGSSVTKGYKIVASQTSDDPEAVASPNGNYYTYELAGGYDPATDGKKVSFKLEGQCDDASTADWSAVKTNVLSAQLVWSVEADELTPATPPAPQGPSITSGATLVSDQEWDYEATFTKGTALELAFDGGDENLTVTKVTQGNSIAAATATSANITNTDSSISIASTMWGAANADDVRYLTITLSDSSTIIVKVTIATA